MRLALAMPAMHARKSMRVPVQGCGVGKIITVDPLVSPYQ
ncbi:Flagellar basal-body rod protein FlgF [Pseudomonas savastanoi pv. retacarpa]|nr:Flagellar basal-body rod protein FlgF [Pseudomonas savastanoi pv. retacarpa]